MTRRAFLWCGYVKPPVANRRGGASFDYDFPASVHDIDLAVRAALALGVERDEIYAFVCRDDLLPPDFGDHRYEATTTALERVISSIAHRAAANDPLLFVASNHGLREGLLTSAPVDEFDEVTPQLLTPGALEKHLSPLTGPQVVIVATCHAGAFLRLATRPNRLVLAACAEDETYYVEDEESPHSPFLLKLLGAWCGIVPRNAPPVAQQPLDEAFSATEQQLVSTGRTRPHRSGRVAWP